MDQKLDLRVFVWLESGSKQVLSEKFYIRFSGSKKRINVTDSTYIESTDFGNKIEPEVLIK